MTTATTSVNDNHLGGVLVTMAALGSAAGGLIHLNQIGAHSDFLFMASGFALMGVAQWVFALVVLRRPSRPIFLAGGILHAAIFALWLVTRTVGLGIVPGADVPAEVGFADLAANAFSVALIGVAAIWPAVHNVSNPVVLPPEVATGFKTIVLVGVILLTVPALLVRHEHGSHASEPPTHETLHDLHQIPSHVGDHDPVSLTPRLIPHRPSRLGNELPRVSAPPSPPGGRARVSAVMCGDDVVTHPGRNPPLGD